MTGPKDNPPTIENRHDHAEALAECEDLAELDPELNTPQGERLLTLTTLVEAYEKENLQE